MKIEFWYVLTPRRLKDILSSISIGGQDIDPIALCLGIYANQKPCSILEKITSDRFDL